MSDPALDTAPEDFSDAATVTELLDRWSVGDREAAESLLDRVYGELHAMARRCFRRERPDHTLQPTALVHEVVMVLLEGDRAHWQSRTHFFGLAACMMRRVLVDHARERAAQKRGGHLDKIPLDGNLPMPFRPRALVDLDDALHDLEAVDRRHALIVELRFFGGLTVEEVAECLHLSPRTVARDWRRARAFLFRRLSAESRDAL